MRMRNICSFLRVLQSVFEGCFTAELAIKGQSLKYASIEKNQKTFVEQIDNYLENVTSSSCSTFWFYVLNKIELAPECATRLKNQSSATCFDHFLY